MRKKLAFLTGLAIAGLLVDRLTKIRAMRYFAENPPLPLVKDLFELRYAENPAVGFSMLQFLPYGPRRWLVISITTVVLCALIWLTWRWRSKRTSALVPLALIIGGAAGNLVDRIGYGYVIDFLHLHYRNAWSWPIFNVADSLIFVGEVLFILVNRKVLFARGGTAAGDDA